MSNRLKYHFEPSKGWINDPNGLVYFKGKYHAFFQHYPYAPKWGQMHWGHAISEDLIHWEELPIALYPDQSYDDGGGCYSGSAVVKDEVLYLFYTSVSQELGQTQSMATSLDGIHFEKYCGNPIIETFPLEGSKEFRDPKVSLIGDTYYMVCGTGKEDVGKIVMYTSKDLYHWDYSGVLLEGSQYGNVIECPDLFQYKDKFILMFSQMAKVSHATMFVYGDFDGKTFTPISYHTPEAGPHFYAPQTFLDEKGRRIVIAWLYSWDRKVEEGVEYVGALTIPREILIKEEKICLFPVSEAEGLLASEDPLIIMEDNKLKIPSQQFEMELHIAEEIREMAILKDTKTIEIFLNGGEESITYWLETNL